jgi:hypothetical protein
MQLLLSCQRAYLVEMHFSGGFTHIVAVESSEASDVHEACCVAANRFEYVRHVSDWAMISFQERLGVYGELDRLQAYLDTPESRRQLGVEGAEPTKVEGEPRWFERRDQSEKVVEEIADRYAWLNSKVAA